MFRHCEGKDSRETIRCRLLFRDDHYPVCRLDIQQDSEFATGSGYRKRFYRYFENSDYWKKLHIAPPFIYYLQKHLSSLLCYDSSLSVYGVSSALWCNHIRPINLLSGHAKFVSMNLFQVWQERALSVAQTLRTSFAAYLD